MFKNIQLLILILFFLAAYPKASLASWFEINCIFSDYQISGGNFNLEKRFGCSNTSIEVNLDTNETTWSNCSGNGQLIRDNENHPLFGRHIRLEGSDYFLVIKHPQNIKIYKGSFKSFTGSADAKCKMVNKSSSLDIVSLNYSKLYFSLKAYYENNQNDLENKKTIVETEIEEKKTIVAQSNSNSIQPSLPKNQCVKLYNKLSSHIENEEYDMANSVVSLLEKMNCTIDGKQELSQSFKVPTNKYSASQLSCSVGPIGKTIFGSYGKYLAKSFNNDPPKSCNDTHQYCLSRAKSIANGANISPSERSSPKTYTGNCYSYGSYTDCTITGGYNSGGFVGGLADGLSQGIEVAAAKKRIFVSNFELCMSDMGYELTK